MERDHLEKYVAEHRSEFDTEELPPMLWDRIEGQLGDEKKSKLRIFRLVGMAASAIVILTAGMLIGIELGSPSSGPNHQIAEFTKAENYFVDQYNVKWSEFQELGGETEAVEADLEQLDNIYNEMKAELLQSPDVNTDKVIKTLINSYRTKIDLLETVLDRTKQQQTKTLKLEDYEMDEI